MIWGYPYSRKPSFGCMTFRCEASLALQLRCLKAHCVRSEATIPGQCPRKMGEGIQRGVSTRLDLDIVIAVDRFPFVLAGSVIATSRILHDIPSWWVKHPT